MFSNKVQKEAKQINKKGQRGAKGTNMVPKCANLGNQGPKEANRGQQGPKVAKFP